MRIKNRISRRARPSRKMITHLLLLLLLSTLLLTVSAVTVDEIFQQAENQQVPDSITVGVYYYPWHGDDFHRGSRGDGYLRSKLTPPQQPMLGEYDDRRASVVEQHLLWAQQANIQLWVCSWWGPGRREDETIRGVILKHTALNKHKIALLYEGGGRGIKASDGWDTSNVYPDMEYICQAYFSHPNYYRIQGRPVIVIYLSRQMHNKGVLMEVLQQMRKAASDKCSMTPFIIGDHVWNNPPSGGNYEPFLPGGLDAVTNYDVYGNVGSTPYALQENIDAHYAEARKWKAFAAQYGVGFVPGVAPGYNDRGVRLANNNVGLSRKLDAQSEHGTLFAAHLTQARQLTEDSIDNLLLVNSWNEWHEDSQIEPVYINEDEDKQVATLPTELTNGIDYECYGTKYLDILRRATCPDCEEAPPGKYRGILLKKDPFETDPPPAKAMAGVLYYTVETERANFRNRLSTRQNIATGDYTSIDATTVTRHIEQSKQANIGLWIVEWTGAGRQQDNLLRTEILARNDLGDMKVSLLYQARGRVNEQTWDMSNVVTDIQHFARNLATNDHFYKVAGRPVIFISLTRWFHAKKRLRQLTELIRKTAKDNGIDKVFLVGDQVWQEAPIADDYEPFELLDAIINVDVYGNMRDISSGLEGEARLEAFYQRQRDWRDFAWQSGCAYIPSAIPGFNNRGYYPERNDPVVSRQLNTTADQGSFFKASLQRARYLVDSTLSGLMVISSFNRFREDTQIEPVVGKVTSEPAEMTLNNTYYGYGSLYLDMLKEYTQDLDGDVEKELDNEDLFGPLSCNTGLNNGSCTKWSVLFGSAAMIDDMVTIPCGQCVVMDSGTEVIVNGGIDILGMLDIKDSGVSISTPFIRVQGEFHIDAMGAINGSPMVEIKMIDSERLGIEKFIPASSNAFACGVERCDPGPKSIFVAGGRVVFSGIDADTPAWVTLEDIVSAQDETLPDMNKPLSCPTSGILIQENFQSEHNASDNGFRPNLGTDVEIHGTFWEVQQRRSTYSGAHVDLKDVRDCLSSTETYEFVLKVRMIKEGLQGAPTVCSTTGTDCIKIFADHMQDSLETQISEQKYTSTSNNAMKYGQWINIKGQISFSEAELNLANVYLSLRVSGGERNVDIQLDKFKLQLAQGDACAAANTDCRDLVACNGGAEYASISPFSGTGGGQPVIQTDEETENRYWHFEDGGMSWNVPAKCMVENAVYKLKMKLRSSPKDPSPVTVMVYLKGGEVFEEVGSCTESAGEWTDCFAFVKVSQSLVQLGGGISVQFTRVKGSAYDVDDLSVRFSHMDSPVTDLVVSSSIQDKWMTGAQVLITSQSLSWNQQEIRTIQAIATHGTNTVKITLDSSISSPMTKQDGDFPVHVALLSRNIAVHEGHLTVYRTPELVQKISGAAFHKSPAQANTKAIRITQSNSVEGSVISKNSIIDSEIGCIEIYDSASIAVDGNVAYSTTGDCFVVGNSQGIALNSNLGAKTIGTGAATFLVDNAGDVEVEGNIAAGSQGGGIDIGLQSSKEISSFDIKNNVAYSNGDTGMLIHSNDNDAPIWSLFLNDLKAYRNVGAGLSLDVPGYTSVALESSLFADNKGGVIVKGAKSLDVRNVTLYGQSTSYYLVQQSSVSGERSSLCENGESYAGIEVPASTSTSIEGIAAAGFHHSDTFESHCMPHILRVSPSTDASGEIVVTDVSSLEDGNVQNVDFCSLSSNVEVVVIDQDGSMSPSSNNEPSSIVPDGHSALAFVPPTAPTALPFDCALYLPDTCLRSVRYFIDPSSDAGITLKICDRATMQICNTYQAVENDGVLNNEVPLSASKQKYFAVTLPEGRYEAVVLDTNGNRVWPTFAEALWGEVHCKGAKSGYLEEGSIWLPEPPVAESICESNLLSLDSWIGGDDGMDMLPNSNTICETAFERGTEPSKYLAGQYLDTRCLREEQEYVVEFNVGPWFADIGDIEGEVHLSQDSSASSTGGGNIPEVGILFTSHDGRRSWVELLDFGNNGAAIEEDSSSKTQVTTTRVGPVRPRRDLPVVGEGGDRRILRGSKDDDDKKGDSKDNKNDEAAISDTEIASTASPFRGSITLDYRMGSAASAFLFVRRTPSDTVTTRLCVDDISFKIAADASAA